MVAFFFKFIFKKAFTFLCFEVYKYITQFIHNPVLKIFLPLRKEGLFYLVLNTKLDK